MENDRKKRVREKIWSLMEENNLARFPRPVFGRVPNFVGAREAALTISESPEYLEAECIFTNPDAPQQPFRENALKDGKTLILATPGIREGFLELDPSTIGKKALRTASTIKGSFKEGKPVHPSELQIDLFMAGSVGVTTTGGRLGKGKGYTDLEYGLLKDYDAFSRECIVTTVHEVQILENIPMGPHDLPVDIIATPRRIIRTDTTFPRPDGIHWELLSEKRINRIPLLQELKDREA